MKLALISTLAILASCGHRANVTPSPFDFGKDQALVRLSADALQCEVLPINSKYKILGECRYTVEDESGVHFRRIEFRRTR